MNMQPKCVSLCVCVSVQVYIHVFPGVHEYSRVCVRRHLCVSVCVCVREQKILDTESYI